MFLDLTARVTKANSHVLRSILSEIVSQFHFFRFSLFEFALKHMIIQTKKYLKVRPKRHNWRQLKLAKSHEILSRKSFADKARGSPRVLRAYVPAKISGSRN